MITHRKRILSLCLCLMLLGSLFPSVLSEGIILVPADSDVELQIEQQPIEDSSEEADSDFDSIMAAIPEELPVVEEETVSPGEEPAEVLSEDLEEDLEEDTVFEEEAEAEEEELDDDPEENPDDDLPAELHFSLDFCFDEDADSDTLINFYAEQQLNKAKNRRAMFRAAPDETRGLSNSQSYAYYILKDCILRTAAGELPSTAYDVAYGEYGVWTAAELGYEAFTASNVKEALETVINLNTMLKALLSSCPYELYWFDKTVGIHTDIIATPSEQEIHLTRITYYFAVSSEYAAANYVVDTSQADRIMQAVQTAKDIVFEAASLSDYEKLRYYNQRICALTEYNYAAARGAAYGNPWQMIWVFDGDTGTKVVCEGYAKAFQYLCDLTDFASSQVYCISVTGDMDRDRHMWNIVSMDDGRNYMIDVTNNDSGASAGELLFLKGYISGDPDTGYRFRNGRGSTLYAYDAQSLSWFGRELLTLSPENYGTVHTHTPSRAAEENRKEASCTEDGSYETVIHCTKCGEEISRETVVIPALGHNPVLQNQKNASYDEPGYTGDQVCSVCGELLEIGTEIPKLVFIPKTTAVSVMDADNSEFAGKTVFYDLGRNSPLRLEACCLPAEASQEVTWTVNDSSGAYADYQIDGACLTVSSGRKTGSVVLTATAQDGSRKSTKVTVRFVRYASSVQILDNASLVTYQSGLAITGGQGITLRTDINNDRTLTDRTVLWSVSGNAASITQNGRLTTVNVTEPQQIIVTAQVKARPEISDSMVMTVYPAAKSAQILLDGVPAGGSLTVSVGRSLSISASLLPAGVMQSGIWTLSNSSVLRFDPDAGTLTGLAPGSATLTFRSGSLRTQLSLKVVKPVESVDLDLQSGSSPLLSGKTLQLKASVLPADATLKTVLWQSSDSSVATVSTSGRVTAKAVSVRSAVTITALAKDGSGALGTFSLLVVPTVSEIRIYDSGAPVSGTTITARVGETLSLSAAVSPADAEQSVTWKSSNTRVAEVSPDGTVTVKSRGSARITATATDGSRKTANVTIRIS